MPLGIRNQHYPQDFQVLPNDHLNFAIIDDEVPLLLNEKVDYKDYIDVEVGGQSHYVIVNPIPKTILENDARFANLKKQDNGQVSPTPSPIGDYRALTSSSLNIPRLVAQYSILGTTNGRNSYPITLPVIIPVVKGSDGVYDYPDTNKAAGTSVGFKLVTYLNVFRNGTKIAALLV